MLGRAADRRGAEDLRVCVVERSLERGGGHVPVEHARVLVVENRRLHAPAEKRLRLAHEVLVERVLTGDEDGQPVISASRAAPLLAQAGDRSREADRDDRVEHPDVDAELEGVCRADSEQLAGEEALLDLAPLRCGVAGPVRREPRRVSEPVGRELVDQLCGATAFGEHECA